ncbi:MAG: hypothetical protein IJ689_02915 [Alphaproteobacteria bacterium]|nr:hypothetical protein [Alphaproteobacteria bacterium]
MKKELYLFIIWHNARFMEKHIVNDIKKKFEIFQIYDVTWSPQFFGDNLSRFYGKKLPKSCKKEKEIGNGSFLVVLVYDRNPQFSEGKNIAVITAKHAYRQMVGSNLVHASDNLDETQENLLFLLGKNLKEIEKEESFTIPKKIETDIAGVKPWSNTDEALNAVRLVPFTKITAYKGSYLIHSRHADIVRRILNASSHFRLPGRHKYFIKVGKSKQPIYIRKVS